MNLDKRAGDLLELSPKHARIQEEGAPLQPVTEDSGVTANSQASASNPPVKSILLEPSKEEIAEALISANQSKAIEQTSESMKGIEYYNQDLSTLQRELRDILNRNKNDLPEQRFCSSPIETALSWIKDGEIPVNTQFKKMEELPNPVDEVVFISACFPIINEASISNLNTPLEIEIQPDIVEMDTEEANREYTGTPLDIFVLVGCAGSSLSTFITKLKGQCTKFEIETFDWDSEFRSTFRNHQHEFSQDGRTTFEKVLPDLKSLQSCESATFDDHLISSANFTASCGFYTKKSDNNVVLVTTAHKLCRDFDANQKEVTHGYNRVPFGEFVRHYYSQDQPRDFALVKPQNLGHLQSSLDIKPPLALTKRTIVFLLASGYVPRAGRIKDVLEDERPSGEYVLIFDNDMKIITQQGDSGGVFVVRNPNSGWEAVGIFTGFVKPSKGTKACPSFSSFFLPVSEIFNSGNCDKVYPVQKDFNQIMEKFKKKTPCGVVSTFRKGNERIFKWNSLIFKAGDTCAETGDPPCPFWCIGCHTKLSLTGLFRLQKTCTGSFEFHCYHCKVSFACASDTGSYEDFRWTPDPE